MCAAISSFQPHMMFPAIRRAASLGSWRNTAPEAPVAFAEIRDRAQSHTRRHLAARGAAEVLLAPVPVGHRSDRSLSVMSTLALSWQGVPESSWEAPLTDTAKPLNCITSQPRCQRLSRRCRRTRVSAPPRTAALCAYPPRTPQGERCGFRSARKSPQRTLSASRGLRRCAP